MYAEQYDEPGINIIQTGITECTVCKADGKHKIWGCPLVDNINRSEVLKCCIKKSREMYKPKIKERYLHTKHNQNGQEKSPPPHNFVFIPPQKINLSQAIECIQSI